MGRIRLYPYQRPGTGYSPIEGTVYDITLSGDEALLYTSSGVLKYRIKGLSVKYMRIPTSRSYRAAFLGFILVIILLLIAFLIPISPRSIGPGFYEYFKLITILVFTLALIITTAYTIIAMKPKSVLIIVDQAGVEHYYLISPRNREKILRIVSGYR